MDLCIIKREISSNIDSACKFQTHGSKMQILGLLFTVNIINYEKSETVWKSNKATKLESCFSIYYDSDSNSFSFPNIRNVLSQNNK